MKKNTIESYEKVYSEIKKQADILESRKDRKMTSIAKLIGYYDCLIIVKDLISKEHLRNNETI